LTFVTESNQKTDVPCTRRIGWTEERASLEFGIDFGKGSNFL
jgi:hypothetical protein